MELKQLRYFVRIVELGSISRAAAELGLVQSALSQQITRLEGELATRLLQRNPQGVAPTPAGLAFYREAQLTLRHAEQAARVAQQSRLSGTVTVGLAPSTAAVLGLPLMLAMHQRYPDVRLHLVESLSGHLLRMLQARQLDVAVLFDRATQAMQNASSGSVRWQAQALLQEDLFVIRKVNRPGPKGSTVRLSDLQHLGLILPTGSHGLRSTLDSAFARADSLAMLMDAVDAGLGATLQPWAAVARYPDAAERFVMQRIVDTDVRRTNVLCSLPDEELSPAALGTQTVLREVVLQLVKAGQWQGVHHKN
jgi:LysR family transcriptional regulator, regulatory protein for tcuABC